MKRPSSLSNDTTPAAPLQHPFPRSGWLKSVKKQPFRYMLAMEELEGRCLWAWSPVGLAPQLLGQQDSSGN
jgi:hypothetical protein